MLEFLPSNLPIPVRKNSQPVLTGKVVIAQDLTSLDDPNRRGGLRSCESLDTQPEPAFDRLAQLAAQICQMRLAAMTFVDEKRQSF
ncbi:MAG: hypothetical protein ABI988_19870 [Nitrospirota bacterium]